MRNTITLDEKRKIIRGLLDRGEIGILHIIANVKFAYAKGNHRRTMRSIKTLLGAYPAVMARVIDSLPYLECQVYNPVAGQLEPWTIEQGKAQPCTGGRS